MPAFSRNFMLLLLLPFFSRAQKSYHEMVEDYIVRYKDLAVAEQLHSGVPAAITLAQGIYETGAGSSELCTNAANHFGIKCKNNWTGDTYTYSDDRKDECFRKYKDAAQSYRDHSDFLKNNPRYSALFQLDPEDYEDWARGLKKCGYATNPIYAQKIIQTIEDYQLQEYTTLALSHLNAGDQHDALTVAASGQGMPAPEEDSQEERPVYAGREARMSESKDNGAGRRAAPGRPGITGYYETTRKNGLKGFYARKGDLLLEYAIKHRIRYARLLEWNDLPDVPMAADMFVYLEPKRKTGLEATYTVMPGMDLLQISQETGVQLEQLRKLNLLADGEIPMAGTVLHLQKPLINKPEVYAQRRAGNASKALAETRPVKPDYIYVRPDEGPDAAVATLPGKSGKEAYPVPQPMPGITRSGTSLPAAKAPYPDAEEVAGVQETKPQRQAEDIRSSGQQPERQSVVKPEREMTPLERLKAHMDQVVYGKQKQQEASSAPEDVSMKGDGAPIATLPAKRQALETPAVQKTAERFYRVQSGDTAFGIAKRFDITLKQLQDWNRLPASMTIRKGMKLRVAP